MLTASCIQTLLTQTVADAGDPAILEPSKPVGPLYGWRRVVPSPKPLRLGSLDQVDGLLAGLRGTRIEPGRLAENSPSPSGTTRMAEAATASRIRT
jgi:hypothetical protein